MVEVNCPNHSCQFKALPSNWLTFNSERRSLRLLFIHSASSRAENGCSTGCSCEGPTKWFKKTLSERGLYFGDQLEEYNLLSHHWYAGWSLLNYQWDDPNGVAKENTFASLNFQMAQQACYLQRRHVHKKAADPPSRIYLNALLTNDELSDGSKRPAAQTARQFAELCALMGNDSSDPAYLCYQPAWVWKEFSLRYIGRWIIINTDMRC